MGLDNNIQSPRPDKAIRAWKGETELVHDFRDTDRRGARDADATVNERRCAVPLSLF